MIVSALVNETDHCPLRGAIHSNQHDHNFPVHAVDYCLKEADVSLNELDQVVF